MQSTNLQNNQINQNNTLAMTNSLLFQRSIQGGIRSPYPYKNHKNINNTNNNTNNNHNENNNNHPININNKPKKPQYSKLSILTKTSIGSSKITNKSYISGDNNINSNNNIKNNNNKSKDINSNSNKDKLYQTNIYDYGSNILLRDDYGNVDLKNLSLIKQKSQASHIFQQNQQQIIIHEGNNKNNKHNNYNNDNAYNNNKSNKLDQYRYHPQIIHINQKMGNNLKCDNNNNYLQQNRTISRKKLQNSTSVRIQKITKRNSSNDRQTSNSLKNRTTKIYRKSISKSIQEYSSNEDINKNIKNKINHKKKQKRRSNSKDKSIKSRNNTKQSSNSNNNSKSYYDSRRRKQNIGDIPYSQFNQTHQHINLVTKNQRKKLQKDYYIGRKSKASNKQNKASNLASSFQHSDFDIFSYIPENNISKILQNNQRTSNQYKQLNSLNQTGKKRSAYEPRMNLAQLNSPLYSSAFIDKPKLMVEQYCEDHQKNSKGLEDSLILAKHNSCFNQNQKHQTANYNYKDVYQIDHALSPSAVSEQEDKIQQNLQLFSCSNSPANNILSFNLHPQKKQTENNLMTFQASPQSIQKIKIFSQQLMNNQMQQMFSKTSNILQNYKHQCSRLRKQRDTYRHRYHKTLTQLKNIEQNKQQKQQQKRSQSKKKSSDNENKERNNKKIGSSKIKDHSYTYL